MIGGCIVFDMCNICMGTFQISFHIYFVEWTNISHITHCCRFILTWYFFCTHIYWCFCTHIYWYTHADLYPKPDIHTTTKLLLAFIILKENNDGEFEESGSRMAEYGTESEDSTGLVRLVLFCLNILSSFLQAMSPSRNPATEGAISQSDINVLRLTDLNQSF